MAAPPGALIGQQRDSSAGFLRRTVVGISSPLMLLLLLLRFLFSVFFSSFFSSVPCLAVFAVVLAAYQ